MERARFTEEQIIGGLRDHEAGAKSRSAAQAGRSEATLYHWKAGRTEMVVYSILCEERRLFVALV